MVNLEGISFLRKINQNLPKFTKIYQKLPKVTKSYQNLPKFTKIYQKFTAVNHKNEFTTYRLITKNYVKVLSILFIPTFHF